MHAWWLRPQYIYNHLAASNLLECTLGDANNFLGTTPSSLQNYLWTILPLGMWQYPLPPNKKKKSSLEDISYPQEITIARQLGEIAWGG